MRDKPTRDAVTRRIAKALIGLGAATAMVLATAAPAHAAFQTNTSSFYVQLQGAANTCADGTGGTRTHQSFLQVNGATVTWREFSVNPSRTEVTRYVVQHGSSSTRGGVSASKTMSVIGIDYSC